VFSLGSYEQVLPASGLQSEVDARQWITQRAR